MMQSVNLSEISLDLDLQPRVSITESVVDEYAEAMMEGESFPSVVVFNDGEKNWLADGYHRYKASRKAGLEKINAEFRTGTRQDALKYALSANATHGLRRSQADRRRSVLIALREFGDLSDREIGRMVKVDGKTVAKYRDRLAIIENVFQRIDGGESFRARHGEDHLLFLFRLPDDHDRPGMHYVKEILICPTFVIWDKRGIRTDCIKKYFNRCIAADAKVELEDFDDWRPVHGGLLPEILRIATGEQPEAGQKAV